MSYPVLDLVILAPVLVIAVIALIRRPRMLAPIGLTTLGAILITAVFDNIMIAAGIVAYAPAERTGWNIGLAPLEDFAYPLAAVLLLPSVWSLTGGSPASEEKADAAD